MAKNTKKHTDFDIIVVGAGLVGLPLALMLARRKLNVALIDRTTMESQTKPNYDGRTTAFSLGSKQILSRDGLWDCLTDKACPIEFIRVLDGASKNTLDFDVHDVEDAQAEAFGWIIENRYVRQKWIPLAKAEKTLHIYAPATIATIERDPHQIVLGLDNGQTLNAPLLIGCDGRGSFIREWAGIESKGWSYEQKAIVCAVTHEKPHENVAIEHFLPDGPFAVLPMVDYVEGKTRKPQSSIVWTEHGRGEKDSFIDRPEDEFMAELQSRFGDSLGRVQLASERFHYPLTLVHAKQYSTDRVALVGEAAHGIHPIAGQGLNLCLRDVAVLVDLLAEAKLLGLDMGDKSLLARYESVRRIDNTAMSVTTDLLNRFFSNDIAPVKRVRQFGLGLIEKLPLAKQFFMRQAMGLKTF